MKKSFIYGGMFLALISLSSCDESFNDWASLQKNDQEAAAAAYGLTFTGSGVSVDMNDTNKPDSIKLMTVTNSDSTVNNVVVKNVTVNGYVIPFALKGTSAYVSTAQLDSVAKVSLKSQKYEKRNLTVAATAAAVLKTGEAVEVKGTATQEETPIKTPDVDSKGYFILGDATPNGWNTPIKPLWLKETAAGSNIFTATVTTAKDDSNWFNFYGGSSYKGDATIWDDVNAARYGCAVNGDDATFNYVVWSGSKTPVITGAGTWIVTFNANTWTYTVAKPVMYMAGKANGWQQIDYLGSNDGDNFTGFMYLDNNGFKFCTQADWNGTNYGKDFSTAGNADNINLPDGDTEGYYKVDLKISGKTMTLTPITVIGIVGDATADGWPNDNNPKPDGVMTYNKTDRAWEISGVTLKAGDLKFRANYDWAINWGGTTDNLTQGGDNIKITESGTYDIKLYAWANGFAKCKITKK